MGAESPAIIGSILSIIVIVAYGKLTASKEEKSKEKHIERARGTERVEYLSSYLVLDYSD